MVPLGTPAPVFELASDEGLVHTTHSLMGEHGLLVMFLCNHCPFVVHLADELGRIGADYHDRGIGIVGINSNDSDSYPDDAPERMPAFAASHGITFPYLFDPTQSVAQSFHAVCTPDFFLYDTKCTLVYRGQLDDSRPGEPAAVNGADLRRAMDALCQGLPVDAQQTPSMGCSIKWKAASSCGK